MKSTTIILSLLLTIHFATANVEIAEVGRIIGSILPKPAYLVSVVYEGQPLCTMTMIEKRIAVGAAHCFNNLPVSLETAVAQQKLAVRGHDNLIRPIAAVRVHENYSNTVNNDISVALLTEDDLKDVLRIFGPEVTHWVSAIVNGWTERGAIHIFRAHIGNCPPGGSSGIICANVAAPPIAFLNDVGPMIADGKLLGIVSRLPTVWGAPWIFTNVTHHRSWIQQVIGEF